MNWNLVDADTNVAHNHAPTLRLSLRLFSLSRSFFFSLSPGRMFRESKREQETERETYNQVFQKLSKQFCVCVRVCVCVCVMERK